jgi:hypothetical protein
MIHYCEEFFCKLIVRLGRTINLQLDYLMEQQVIYRVGQLSQV